MTIDLDDVNSRIADGIYDDGRLSKRDQEAAFAALAEIVAEVERLRAERDHFRKAWSAAQVRLDCGTDAAEALREERAAVVAWLREHGDQRRAVLADRIERGEHRASDCPYCGAPSEPGGCADCAAEGYERGEHRCDGEAG